MTRKNQPRSFVSTPWTDRAIDYILDVTDYRSRASLLTPAILALLTLVVSTIEKDGLQEDAEILEKGREILRKYARMDPTAGVDRDV